MWTALLATALSFAVLVVLFVPLERVFPARRGQLILRREWTLDLAFFLGQYLVWNGVAIALLTWLDALCAGTFAGPRAALATLPTAVQALLAVVLGDFLVYWFHRACHAWEPLWRIHAVHHSSETLDFMAAHREHPLDGLLTQLFANLPAFFLGFDVSQLAALATFRGMWSIFIHSNVRLPLGPLKWLLGAPELHHWHHARVERTTHNFANTAPWLDLVFRTHHAPKGEECYELGLTEPMPRDYVGHLLHPLPLLGHLARRGPIRLSGAMTALLLVGALLATGCKKSRGDTCSTDGDCRKGLRCLSFADGKRACGETQSSPDVGRAEAMETVVRDLRLPPEARARLRGTVAGGFAAVYDPQGQCFVLKRGAIGLYAITSRFTPGQPPTLPSDAPADLLKALPGCTSPQK